MEEKTQPSELIKQVTADFQYAYGRLRKLTPENSVGGYSPVAMAGDVIIALIEAGRYEWILQ